MIVFEELSVPCNTSDAPHGLLGRADATFNIRVAAGQ